MLVHSWTKETAVRIMELSTKNIVLESVNKGQPYLLSLGVPFSRTGVKPRSKHTVSPVVSNFRIVSNSPYLNCVN